MNNDRTKLKPSEVAGMWGLCYETVIGWIKSGELKAIDISRSGSKKPRYLVDVADLEVFERSKSVEPETQPKRKKRKNPAGYVEYV